MPRRRDTDPDALRALAARDERVVTLQSLTEAGVPMSTACYRMRPEGPWQRLLPGVVLLHSGTPTPRERVLGVLRYVGSPDALITGPAALRMGGLRSTPSTTLVHALLPHGMQRVSTGYAVTERTIRLPRTVLRAGIPCAPVDRAVIDTARRMTELTDIRALVSEAVQREMCAPQDLVTELRECTSRQTRRPRAVLAEIRAGIRSAVEADARAALLWGGLPGPMWNVDLFDLNGRWLARPDAWFDDEGVALEVDSREWHLNPRDWERTLARHERMTRKGIIVLHATPRRVRSRKTFVDAVAETLSAAAARPRPPVLLAPTRRLNAS